MRSSVFSRGSLKKLNQYVAMPVLFVIFVLSIELIILIFTSSIFETVNFITSYQSPISSLAVKTLIKGISLGLTISVLVFIIKKRSDIQDSDNPRSLNKNQIKSFMFIALIYLGCHSFLVENSAKIVNIFFSSETYEVWPALIFSRASFEDVAYQITLLFYLFLFLPIYEELLFRKVIVQELTKEKLGTGWIISVSSLIYSLPFFLYEVVEYPEGQAIYSAFLRFSSGLILCFLYLRTQKLVYPILLKFLSNLTIYIRFLVFFSSYLGQIGEYIIFLMSILVILGLLIFFIVIFDGLLSLRDSSSSPPSWIKLYSNFSFLKNPQLTTMFRSIIIILPFFPYGFIFFIDHTVLYNDYLGLMIKSCLKFVCLGGIVILCILNVFQTETKSDVQGILLSPRPILSRFYQKTRENYLVWTKSAPRLFITHLTIFLLTLGVLSPFLLVSVSVVATIEVFIIFSAEVYTEITLGHSPFISYTKSYADIRSNFVLIGIQEITEESFYFLKHSNGKWYFLPDTFMFHAGDWFHGLLSVGAWLGCLILFVFIIREYRRGQKITAGASIVALIITEIAWILILVLRLGSVSADTGKPTSPSFNQFISDLIPNFVQSDFKFVGFFFLPIGLICFLLAALILIISGVREKRKEKKRLDSVS